MKSLSKVIVFVSIRNLSFGTGCSVYSSDYNTERNDGEEVRGKNRFIVSRGVKCVTLLFTGGFAHGSIH